MGGEKGNLVISDIVAAIRGRTGIEVYLLDTFNFSQVKAKRGENRALKGPKNLEMTQAIQDVETESRFVRLNEDQKTLTQVAQQIIKEGAGIT
jgi:hypothetical protein